MVEVSIGIVTYNSECVIRDCLKSLHSNRSEHYQVIVADNNSSDRTVDLVRETDPDAIVVVNEENVGFGRAHNELISMSEAEFYLALNDDAVLTSGYVEILTSFLNRNQAVGSAMGKVLYPRESGSRTSRVYSIGHFLRPNLVAVNRGDGLDESTLVDKALKVFGVNAAAAVYRRRMLEDTKYADGEYFDSSYFMYGEDVDLDWRAWRRGWESWCVPSAIAYHKSGARENLANKDTWNQCTSNHLRTLLKNADLDMLLRVVPYYGANCCYKAVIHPSDLIDILQRILKNRKAIVDKRARIMRGTKMRYRDLAPFMSDEKIIEIIWQEIVGALPWLRHETDDRLFNRH